MGFRYLRCFHLYAQQCLANVGVSIYRKYANDELKLLQTVLNLETSLSEEDHERLAHAMQGEERGDEIKGFCLECCMTNCGKPQPFCPEISSQEFWGSGLQIDTYMRNAKASNGSASHSKKM